MVGVAASQVVSLIVSAHSNTKQFDLMLLLFIYLFTFFWGGILDLQQVLSIHPPHPDLTHCFSGDLRNLLLGASLSSGFFNSCNIKGNVQVFLAHRDALMTKTNLTFPAFCINLWILQFNSVFALSFLFHYQRRLI